MDKEFDALGDCDERALELGDDLDCYEWFTDIGDKEELYVWLADHLPRMVRAVKSFCPRCEVGMTRLALDIETLTAMLAKRVPLLEHEIRVAALTFNETNYGAATNSGTAYTLANIASFDLGLDVDLAKGRLLAAGETDSDLSVVMSRDMFFRARASGKLQNRLRGIGVASDTILNVDEQAVAEALGVKEVLIGKNSYDASLEGVSYSGTAIWNNTYVWVGKLGTGGSPESMLSGGAQYTLNWAQYGSPINVFTYDEPQTNSEVVRASHHVTEKVVNSAQGTLIATQYS